MTWTNRLLDNSLWLAALGLMLASSGIDGAYMARMMEPQLWPLGYVLNTVSDLSGLIIMLWFGRLRQGRKGSKRYRLALALLPAEIIAIAYSWFFSWLQLRMVLRPIEGVDAHWVAPIAAGFIPLLLAFIGWGQALREGRFEEPVAQTAASETPAIATTPPPTATIADWRAILASLNGNERIESAADVQRLLTDHGLASPSPPTARRWAKLAREERQ